MNLYEFEGKSLFEKYDIAVPNGVLVRRGDDYAAAYSGLKIADVVVKPQILGGGRGKQGGIRFCTSHEEVARACEELFDADFEGKYVAAVRIEEKVDIAVEHYVSITYDTKFAQPVLVYSARGGVDIETVADEEIQRFLLDVRVGDINVQLAHAKDLKGVRQVCAHVWKCFLNEDVRVIEINPLAELAPRTKFEGARWVALDAKVVLDDDAFYRHKEWGEFEPRTMMGRPPTERETAVAKIDEGEGYYRGTAGKYVELDGDIAVLFSGGGASIASMDALKTHGLSPANYTEYSGNPPREKVRELAKMVLSKPGLRGLWIAGGVANFTDVAETFAGICDALDEVKPSYPIVVRRAGPNEEEGMRLMRECGERHGLRMKLFGKEVGIGETAKVLAEMVKE